MQFPTLLLSAATAALTPFATAAPPSAFDGMTAPRINAAAVQQAGGFKDMILTEIQTITLATTNATADNKQISFHIADPNFNTSTTCRTTWLEHDSVNETNTRPGSYIPCTANPGVKESYRWFFAGYNSLGDFSLQLAHSFSDPENYPPPWDVVGLFSTVNITLACSDGQGGQECALGQGESVKAPINGAVN